MCETTDFKPGPSASCKHLGCDSNVLRQLQCHVCADLWLFLGLSVSFVNHFVVGFIIAAVALPLHTLPLPSVWGYFPVESKRGLCTCCCGKIGETPRPPRRPARSMPLRLWTLLLYVAQVCKIATAHVQLQRFLSDLYRAVRVALECRRRTLLQC